MKPPVNNLIWAKFPKGDVTQFFGENPLLYSSLGIGLKAHNGIDIVRPYGEPLYAIENGTVVDVKESPDGYGRHIRLLCPVNERGIGNEWTYGHLASIAVKIGDEVKEGDLIGTMGNSGFVVSGNTPYWKYNPFAGCHLHLGKRLYKLDKNGWKWNRKAPAIETLNYDNGYLGSVDFYNDFLEYETVEDKKVRPYLLTLISLLNQLKNLLK